MCNWTLLKWCWSDNRQNTCCLRKRIVLLTLIFILIYIVLECSARGPCINIDSLIWGHGWLIKYIVCMVCDIINHSFCKCQLRSMYTTKSKIWHWWVITSYGFTWMQLLIHALDAKLVKLISVPCGLAGYKSASLQCMAFCRLSNQPLSKPTIKKTYGVTGHHRAELNILIESTISNSYCML